jgi:hypothetical protein
MPYYMGEQSRREPNITFAPHVLVRGKPEKKVCLDQKHGILEL